ncbi:MAG: sulfatase-like hydrolase/transferase [Verrucomicrobiae bacterium]|nr:sulfatase-like hydrolase/transferase [Verrucomicrobiae bacterium]
MNFSRFLTLSGSLLLVGITSVMPCLAKAETLPNVVFILTDNHGAWTMGCYGNPDIQTPNVDRMAAGGVRFVNAFANNAVCSPTRASYLTGLMPSQHGVHCFLHGGRLQTGEGEMRNTLDEFTSLPEILKSNGYACGLVGKWHLGNNFVPNEGLDDYWITMPAGGTSTFHGAQIIEGGKIRKEESYLTDFWTEHALKFIDQQAGAAKSGEKPFFLYLAYNGPYGLSRYQLESSGNRWADFYADKEMASFPRGVIHPWEFNNREYFGNLTSIRRYGEELSAVDDGVGAILSKLKALGIEEDTLVIFAADQGWAGGQQGLWGMGDHTRPVNAREYSMRIPMIFYQPGKIAAGEAPEMFVSNVDFLPSVLGYLGLGDQMPKEPKSPGRDFSAVLRDGEKAKGDWEDVVFYEFESLRCVRTKAWKFVERFEDGFDEFYRIDEDPEETANLLLDPAGMSDEAKAALADLRQRLDAFFNQYAEPKYDLWNGGGSQSKTLVWGEEAKAREEDRIERGVGAMPSAIDPGFDPPKFEMPDGLIAEVAAGPPLVQHPIMAGCDDRGRLFVSENAGLNLNKEELEKQKPNSIRLLEDTNRDGLFDKSTVFADGLTFPQGALWLMGSLYVMSPPSLWRFEDTDDDGVADVREELVTGFDYTGNAADVHGPFLHPDGRIYWCHGRKGHEVYDPKTGELVSKNKGARIWSCRPDGSDVQVFAGGGMDNPVEIDFTETGEIIGVVNLFYGRPRGDVIVHWQRGGAYPRHDQETVVAEFLRTGPLLSEVHNFGHVAVSGMTRYRSGHLNPEWKDNILVTHFNTQTVTRTQLEPSGATFRAVKTEPFLKIQDPDVHVTDVLEDPNGDLLVLDTGGWFRIGCPTSQVAKPEIPGAIYRIRKAGPANTEGDPLGLTFDWENATAEAIAKKLDDPSFAIRERARTELAIQGDPALPELETILSDPETHSPMARQNAVWTLARMRFTDSPDLILAALGDPDGSVQQAACKAIAATRDWRTIANNEPDEMRIEIERNHRIVEKLASLLQAGDPPTQRCAAEALGRMADPAAVGTLLGVVGRESTDRSLEHAVIHALIRIGDSDGIRAGLSSGNTRRKSAALIALDQTGGGALDVLTLLPYLDTEDESLRGTALWLAARHEEWDAAIANRFHEWLDAGEFSEAQAAAFAQLAPAFLATPPMQTLLGQVLASESATLRQLGFEAIAAADLPGFDESWREPMLAALRDPSADPAAPALKALAKTRPEGFDERLQAIANDESVPALRRVLALRAIGKPDAALGEAAFDLLKKLAGPEASPLERLDAVQLISTAKLTRAQLLAVAELVRYAGPLDLPILLQTFDRSRDPEVGMALASVLPDSKGVGNANPDELARLFNRYPPEVSEKVAPVIEELKARKEQQAARLAEIEPRLAEGDPERGKAAYLSGKGACITCHQIGEDGRSVGPNLSTIGRIRTGRDLLESILYPSESIARDFESFQITLKDGNVQMGLIKRETSGTIYLTNPAGEEIPIARSTVANITSIPMSLMPQGLEQALQPQELLDLVAFLKSRTE